jgi:hypothetical protein
LRELEEIPDFHSAILIYYHEKEAVKAILERNRFGITKEWKLDYAEIDGSITMMLYLLRKSYKRAH